MADQTSHSGDVKDRTRVHYDRFSHLFLYPTEKCQLRCKHCYMGDRLERGLTMSYDQCAHIMTCCRRLGARYLTIVGGEPTLYEDLPQVVNYAKTIGYHKVNIDTNGLRVDLLRRLQPENLNYIRVSLDGATAETHETVRGAGTYHQTVESIRQLVKAGYRVSITSTIFQFNIHEAAALLELADEIGISLVNYHVFSVEGYGTTNSHWALDPEDWIDFCEYLEAAKNKYRTSIWYPPTWATREKLNKYVAEGYRGCLGYSLDRLSVFPDGTCYLCSVIFDEPVHFGIITDAGFILNKEQNEFEMFTRAIFQAPESWLSGCPAEEFLHRYGEKEVPANLVSMCRCWKSQA